MHVRNGTAKPRQCKRLNQTTFSYLTLTETRKLLGYNGASIINLIR